MPTPRYVIITPVRDEEAYVETTIKSVASQTILPDQFVIVNDGSTDRTGVIIDAWARRYSWLSAVHRANRGSRLPGAGVIEAFYDGYRALQTDTWDFIVKLDGDLSFEPDYFEKCFAHFAENPKLGIGGGVVQSRVANRDVLEKNPAFHVRGATKIYCRSCWDAIGGVHRVTGWDTLDEVKANMLGWETKSFLDLKVTQHRSTGATSGTWNNLVKNGRANYISGYHPVFMFCKCVKRLLQKPYILGSTALLFGFAGAWLTRIPQVDDKLLIRYLRREQLRRLLLQTSIWK